jgi:hypothetical protein
MGLAALAAQMNDEQAPPHVEATLLRAAGRRTRRRFTSWAAVAAAAVLAIVLLRWSAVRPTVPTVAEQRDVVTDFVPLRYGPALLSDESAHLVRIRLPETEVARFGIPVVAAARGRLIDADVLIGEDGTPRAIRLVQQSSR